MNRRLQYALAIAGAAAALLPQAASAALVGQWDFNAGTLAGTVGAAITYADGPGAATQTGTQFGTTTALGIPDIGGTPANVMKFPAATDPAGYVAPISAAGNGGGSLVNQWTLIIDVLYPPESNGKWRTFIETDGRLINPDAEFFVNPANGIGVSGAYQGVVLPNTWHRIAFTVDQAEGANRIRKYIDGVEVGTQGAGGIDGRWALSPGGTALLFSDNDGDVAPGFVNSIQIYDVALPKPQIAAFGGATAAGLPTTLPPIPSYLENWIPTGAFAKAGTEVGVVLNRGSATVSGITANYNGAALTPAVATVGDLITVKVPGASTTPRTDHTLIVRYTDSVTGARSITNKFRVPLTFEDFDSVVLGPNVDEGLAGEQVFSATPPAGWTLDNSQMPTNGVATSDNFGRSWEEAGIGVTEFKGWTFLNRDWWVQTAGDQTRTQFSLGTGTVAVADPDEWDDLGNPDGTVGYFNSFFSSPNISLVGVAPNSVTLKFSSSWRPEAVDDAGPDGLQTNDQTAVIRVSYDGGAPVEILKWSSIEGSPTFKPDAQNEAATLVINNPAGATNMKLTFGMLNAGNDWWWAVDNIVVDSGILGATITSQPRGVEVEEGSTAILSVSSAGDAPLAFQWYRGIGPSRTLIPGATAASYSISLAKATDGGIYSVSVSNVAGSVDSVGADVKVILRNRPKILLTEDFNGLVLGPSVDEGVAGEAVWTKTSPAGWTIDDTGVPGAGDPANDGVTEWAGWSFADRAWWAQTAGNQRRVEFLKGTGAVAIADGDEWDDQSHLPGSINTFITTPAINIAGLKANSVVLRFDSSWRPEEPQKAIIRVQYGNGTPTEILRWDGSTTSPNFHADNVNETVTIGINNPADATTMKVTFGYIDAGNNWWWAFDNVVVSGTPSDFDSLKDSLVTYLPFNGSYADTSGNNVNGAAVGATSFVPGKAGQAVRVTTAPGSTNYVTLGQQIAFGTNRNFTVAFWAKLMTTNSDPSFIGTKNWDGGGNVGWVIATGSNNRIQWNLNTTSGTRKDYDSAGGTFNGEAWRHIVVAFDRTGNATTYVDGAQIDSRTIAGNLGQSMDPAGLNLNIGQDGTGRYDPTFEAIIDEVAIWSRILETEEVTRAYSKGAAGVGLFATVPPPAVTASASLVNGDVKLSWTGGTAPFLVQGATTLGGTWTDIVTTSANEVTIPAVGPAAFLRIQDSTTKSIRLFRANISPAQEVANPAVVSPATGKGFFSISGLNAAYYISFDGTVGNVTASHLHNAAAGSNGGVLFHLAPSPSFPAGTRGGIITGTQVLTAAQLTEIENSRTYINIHSTSYPGGELRGQLLP
jgi:hypothetical protein